MTQVAEPIFIYEVFFQRKNVSVPADDPEGAFGFKGYRQLPGHSITVFLYDSVQKRYVNYGKFFEPTYRSLSVRIRDLLMHDANGTKNMTNMPDDEFSYTDIRFTDDDHGNFGQCNRIMQTNADIKIPTE